MSEERIDAQLAEANAQFAPHYERLGITGEMEFVILGYLEAIGAAQLCFGQGSCSGGCTGGMVCRTTMRGNCVCQRPRQ